MNENQSRAWHPNHPGGSTDILPFYAMIEKEIPQGGTFVEVGVFFGRSISFMGTLRKDLKLYAIDQWENTFVDAGETLPVGPDKELCDRHGGLYQAFFATMEREDPSTLDRLQIIRNKSHVGLRLFEPNSVDFCFIDAGHSFAEVTADLEAAKRCVKKGGIIAGHDYCWNNEVVQAVDQFFGKKPKLAPWGGEGFHEHAGWVPEHSTCFWVTL